MQNAIIKQLENGMVQDMSLEESHLKAINLNVIKQLIALARASLDNPQPPIFVKVPTLKGFEMFRVEDIVRIETHSYFARSKNMSVKNGDGNSTHIYTAWENGHFRLSRKICDWKKLLDAQEDFVQTHQSHLINFRHIRRVYEEDGMRVEMINGEVVPVAARYKTSLINKLLGNWGES